MTEIFWILVVVSMGSHGVESKAIYGFKTQNACIEAAKVIYKNTPNEAVCIEDSRP